MIVVDTVCVEGHGKVRSFGSILKMIHSSLLARDWISRQAQPRVKTVLLRRFGFIHFNSVMFVTSSANNLLSMAWRP